MTNIPVMRNSVGRETLTVDNTAGGTQLASVPDTARHALINAVGTAGSNDARMTTDGTAPVATTTGVLVKANLTHDWFMHPLGDFHQILVDLKFIREGGSDATFQVEYFD